MIRVALVDGHELIRIGLKVAMEQDPEIEVALDTDDPMTVLSFAERESLDLILIDVTEDTTAAAYTSQVAQAVRPACASHALQARLAPFCSAHLTQKTVLMSVSFELECLFQALCGDVAGYLIKDTSPRELVAAVHAIACGGVYIHSALMEGAPRQLLRRCVAPEPTAPWAPPLSEREQDILGLLVKGYTNREISEELFLSPKTIESYRAKLYSKLGVRTRAALFSCAIDQGLVAL